MAPDNGSRLAGIWFLASFVWLYCSLDRHTLISQPRLSSVFLLLVSGSFVFAASLFSKWLPGADGRFDSDAVLKASSSSLPPRPRRIYIPCIIVLLILRLEFSYVVVRDFQCSQASVEAFLLLLLAAYKFVSHRPPPPVDLDEPEDMWGNPLDDLKIWLMGSPLPLLLSSAVLSYATFLTGNFTTRSTYFCSPLADQASLVIPAQWAGLFADTVIIILLWRVLSWARTTRSRLRTLGGILLITSFATCVPLLVERYSRYDEIVSQQSLRGIKTLYLFDILSTGIVVATLIISGALMICDKSPLEPIGIATLTSGILAGVGNVLLVGTYQQTSAVQPLLISGSISIGFTLFIYANNMRSVVFIRRIFFLLLLVGVMGFSIIRVISTQTNFIHHPVDELVYQSRVEADRWLRHATVSTSLKIAVKEYEERHHGRQPPPNFDKWYEFARQRKSVIIDKYDQIEADILPFWGLRSQAIQDGLEFLKSQPNIGIINIAGGKPSHNGPADPSQREILDGIVTLISAFAEHLPAMEIAINLQERPKILVPWNEMNQLRTAATRSGFQLMSGRLGKRNKLDSFTGDNIGTTMQTGPMDAIYSYIPASQFRQLQALACPPGSPSRSGVNWDVRNLCASCVAPHSRVQFLGDWSMSLDPCHQPDLFNLHEFHTIPHQNELYQDLLPLFSGSKTSSFSDVLIPFPGLGLEQEYDGKTFNQKQDILLWQANVTDIPVVTHESLHGSQRLRLVHLVRNATAADKIPMLLGIGTEKDSRFQYEDVPTFEGNTILPFRFALTNPSEVCGDAKCELMRAEFGLEPPITELDSRYVMLLDSSDGPAPNLLQTLGSNSVPVVASIFQQWFTERLMPWVHFIPIDLRYHALHSTMSYFIGLEGRGPLNGREQITPARTEDARWIAREGRKWAETALRKEDMEVYMFRLLLEWGRVIDNNRDDMGFELKA
ncbi:hypothetical protein GGR50DRAFT_648316 [Xylaria sp. CBS 124048]|nr:hypothetical protein GGR50DRAFT_648316 [Xylaria sp. CBS 124048]